MEAVLGVLEVVQAGWYGPDGAGWKVGDGSPVLQTVGWFSSRSRGGAQLTVPSGRSGPGTPEYGPRLHKWEWSSLGS